MDTLKVKEAILLFDFKENIQLGRKAKEIGEVYFKRPLRSLFSVILLTTLGNGTLKKHIFNFLSEDLSHNTEFVTQCLDMVWDSSYWKEASPSKVTLWSDCGPHFRTYEMLGYLASIQEKQKITMNYDFFIENHGKSLVDSWFSIVSRIIQQWSLRSTVNMDTTQQLHQVLHAAIEEYSQRKIGWTAEVIDYKRKIQTRTISALTSSAEAILKIHNSFTFVDGKVIAVSIENPQQQHLIKLTQKTKKNGNKKQRLGLPDITHTVDHLVSETRKQQKRTLLSQGLSLKNTPPKKKHKLQQLSQQSTPSLATLTSTPITFSNTLPLFTAATPQTKVMKRQGIVIQFI